MQRPHALIDGHARLKAAAAFNVEPAHVRPTGRQIEFHAHAGARQYLLEEAVPIAGRDREHGVCQPHKTIDFILRGREVSRRLESGLLDLKMGARGRAKQKVGLAVCLGANPQRYVGHFTGGVGRYAGLRDVKPVGVCAPRHFDVIAADRQIVA